LEILIICGMTFCQFHLLSVCSYIYTHTHARARARIHTHTHNFISWRFNWYWKS